MVNERNDEDYFPDWYIHEMHTKKRCKASEEKLEKLNYLSLKEYY